MKAGIWAFQQAIQVSSMLSIFITREMRQHFPFFISDSQDESLMAALNISGAI